MMKIFIKRSGQFIDPILSFFSRRIDIYGAHYNEFGILGLLNFFIPYFLYNQEIGFSDQSFNYRFIATTACFFLIMFSNMNLGSYFHKKILPVYWYFTLLITLPFNSTICLLFGYFGTTWIVNSSLTMLILALLVDWASFIVIYISGIFLAYIIYILNVDNIVILHTEKILIF